MFTQLSWRNIWRNPRRTTVVLTAVTIGVWSMVFLGALMRGTTDQMVRNGIATLTGHIQIHQEGYRRDPGIQHTITQPKDVRAALRQHLPSAARWTSRVRVNAVASNARHSGGVTLVGIDPVREARISFIGDAVSRGRFLQAEDPHAVIVGQALLEKFETQLAHKLVLMSQDATGEIASRAFRIAGVFRAEMEATEKQFVFVTLSAARQMLKLQGGISEVSVLLPSHQRTARVAGALRGALSENAYEVHTWRELLPLVTATLEMYDGFVFLWYLAVFIAMGFGIVNTILMAVLERIREFGLLRAMGMKPSWIVREVLTESFFLLIIGMAVGNILGFLSILPLSATGIDLSRLAAGLEYAGMPRTIYPVVQSRDIAMANMVVFFLGLLVSLYPAVKASRFTPVEAMRHT